jgi:hypothetical protein
MSQHDLIALTYCPSEAWLVTMSTGMTDLSTLAMALRAGRYHGYDV